MIVILDLARTPWFDQLVYGRSIAARRRYGTDEIMVAIVFISQIMAGATIISGMLELFPVR